MEYDLDLCRRGECNSSDEIIIRQAYIQKDDKPNATKQTIRRMRDTSNPIYFIHIGKAGGSSIDNMFKKYGKAKKIRKKYWGFNHFDWSFIETDHVAKMYDSKLMNRTADLSFLPHRHVGNAHNSKSTKREYDNLDVERTADVDDDRHKKMLYSTTLKRARENLDVGHTADVITFLRHPVSRSISQFYYGKTLPWAKKSNQSFVNQTIEEYIHDLNKTWFQPLNDGEGAVDFLAGIFHSGGWVKTDEIDSESKEYLRWNKTAACIIAANRLEQTVWFGLLEDIERSMKLLQISLGLERTPSLPKRNSAARRPYPIPSEITLEIESYLPKDMWLYEYAKRLFEARWKYFIEDLDFVPPVELPPLPLSDPVKT